MCHKCITNVSQGYMTNTPCGEPLFIDYPVLSPAYSCMQCQGFTTPCKPWANDLFKSTTKFYNIDDSINCPYKFTGPLI